MSEEHWKIASIKEDLERKSLETLEWLINRFSDGQIGTGELRIGLQTVFNLTSGLVGPDVYEVIEMAKPDQVKPFVECRVYSTEGTPRLFAIKRETGSSSLTITGQSTLGDKKIASKTYECDSPREAAQRFEYFCQAFERDNGLRRIA